MSAKIVNDPVQRTRRYFSFAWSRFGKDEVKKDWHKDSFSYMEYIPKEIFSGSDKIGLDVGCGSGSDMLHISYYGARMIGIDISDSIKVTRDNTKETGRIHVAQADAYKLPFKDGTFDFSYSFGVLHHLPEPETGFKLLCSKVKSGGYVIIYLYEDFSERTGIERFLLKAVNSLRIITTRMPPGLLYFLCIVFSPLVWLFCCAPYQIFKRIQITKKFASRIPFRHTVRLDCIISDLYDRFSPPIEMRYNEDEVRKWFERAGFNGVSVTNYRGWVAWGKKR